MRQSPEMSSTGSADPDRRAAVASDAITFLFTDIEGSTRLLQRLEDRYADVLHLHHELLRRCFARFTGREVDTQGDSFFVLFDRAADALGCALAAQRLLGEQVWPEDAAVRIRIGIHTGRALLTRTGPIGIDVHRAARVMGAGHGGQVLASASTAASATDDLPPDASLHDLGEHRLKDLEQPIRLYELAHPDLAGGFPPLITLDRRPTNLPAPVSEFVGREQELEAIGRRLAGDHQRLVTLIGPGGSGKTRLALRVAIGQLDRLRDGAFLVDLEAATDTESAIAAIAGVVGAPQHRDRPVMDELKRRLHEREMLLVLDNFEQVTVAGAAIADLLEACPALEMLVTSREALHVRGEHLFPVPPLSLPAPRSAASAADAGRFEAIQLFVERARSVRPDFNLTDDNAAAVTEICRRLDGLPLAIELATARLNLFTPEALRDRLQRRLHGLASGARDLPARQQTLRATIDWSYQLLEPAEQRLFEQLAVFANIPLDAVEPVADAAVADDDRLDPLAVLTSLIDKSLIRRTPDDRLEMLETIREFAAERLAARPDLETASRRAHAQFFTELCRRTSSGLDHAAVATPPTASLSSDLENLELAWRYWTSQGALESLEQVLPALWAAYDATGRYRAMLGVTTDLLEVLESAPPTEERSMREVTLRTSQARALMAIDGYSPEVEAAYGRALAVFEGRRDHAQLYPVLRDLARFYIGGARIDKSIELGQELLRLGEAQDDDAIRLDGRFVIGSGLAMAGDLTGALEHLEIARQLASAAPPGPRRYRVGTDPRVSTLTTAAFLLWITGSPDTAVTYADRAVVVGRELDPFSRVYALFHSGILHFWRSEPLLMRERADAILEAVVDHDFPIWRALGACMLGAATVLLGDPAGGLAAFDEGMERYREMRSPPVFWPFLRLVYAASLAYAGRTRAAADVLEEVLALTGDTATTVPLYLVQGDLALGAGDADRARMSYAKARDMARAMQARMVELQAETRLVRLHDVLGEPDPGDALRAVYATFTEGFDTVDLRTASALLEARR